MQSFVKKNFAFILKHTLCSKQANRSSTIGLFVLFPFSSKRGVLWGGKESLFPLFSATRPHRPTVTVIAVK